VLKKLLFLISILYTLALLIVCLIKLNKLPKIGVTFGDKVFHVLAYALLSFLWYNTFIYTIKLKEQRALLQATVFSVIFGIIIEVLQEALTTFRTFDLNDVLANTIGVFFTVLLVLTKKNIDAKK